MLKRLAFWGKFVLAASIVAGAITLMTYEEHKANDKYQRDCQSHVAAVPSSGNHNDANGADECQDPKKYMPWWYVLIAWPDGITAWLLLFTLGGIFWQAQATVDAVEASRDSLKIQEAEFFQWVDIGDWKVEKLDDKTGWSRSGTQIQNHPGAMNFRISFPLTNNTPRPLLIHSVRTKLEIGSGNVKKEFLLKEALQVPPKSEYRVVIDSEFTYDNVTEWLAFTLPILGVVDVWFSNALGRKEETRFERLVTSRWGPDDETHTISKGHKAEEV